jgi:hypothetical protein
MGELLQGGILMSILGELHERRGMQWNVDTYLEFALGPRKTTETL